MLPLFFASRCSHSKDPHCERNRTATGWGSYSADGSVERRDAAWIAKQGADYLKYGTGEKRVLR